MQASDSIMQKKIRKFLRISNFNFLNVECREQGVLLIVPRDKVRSKAAKGFISVIQLMVLKNQFSKRFSIQIGIEFSSQNNEQENKIYNSLNQEFDNKIKMFLITIKDEETVEAWVEGNKIDKTLEKKIEEHIKLEYIRLTNRQVGTVNWIGKDQDMPTIPAILKVLKICQPVNIATLKERLKKDYGDISDSWLDSRLKLMKEKKHLKYKNGSIILTAKSLTFVPGGRRRSSSDVKRSLELGRREWYIS